MVYKIKDLQNVFDYLPKKLERHIIYFLHRDKKIDPFYEPKLYYLCPFCTDKDTLIPVDYKNIHRVTAEGLENFTLRPSMGAECHHHYIKKGHFVDDASYNKDVWGDV